MKRILHHKNGNVTIIHGIPIWEDVSNYALEDLIDTTMEGFKVRKGHVYAIVGYYYNGP